MTDSRNNNRLNHRHSPGDLVTVRRGVRSIVGEIVTNNPTGSYGVRFGTRAGLGRIVEVSPIEITGRVNLARPVTYRRDRDRQEVAR